jgi:DNA polymerase III epsilon subunit-like protein
MNTPEQRPERPETYISIDVETAGPNPADYPMLSIGACLVSDPDEGFYVELKPDRDGVDERALAVSGLSLARLREEGLDPADALRALEAWLQRVVPNGHVPILVAFNAGFDWMFVTDYFHRYLSRNPFGHSAIDVKAYYMGMTGTTWARTSMRHVAPEAGEPVVLTHHALEDAQAQARIFAVLLERSRQ